MRFLKLILRILGFVCALAIGVPLAALALLQFPAGRTLVSGIASELASAPGQTVKLDGLRIGFDLDARLESLTLSDDTGVWLEANDLQLAWAPLKLLSGTLDVTRISLSQLDFNRLPHQPETPAETSEPPGGVPALPFDITVGSLTLSEINLGDPVLGTPVALTIGGSGQMARDPMVLTADLAVKRIDGVDGELAAQAEFAPQDETLRFDIKASEPRGGLLARLMDVPDLPALGLTLTGSGPLTAWAAELEIALDGHQTVTGSAQLSEAADKRLLSFDLDGDLSRLAPPEAQAFVLGTTQAKGSAEFSLAFAPQSGTLDLTTRTVRLSATGSQVDEKLSAKASLAVSAGDNAMIALELDGRQTAFGPLTTQISADGPLNSLTWSADIALASLATPELRSGETRLKASGTGADLTAGTQTIPFDALLTVHELKGLTAQVQAVDGPLSINATGMADGTAKTIRLTRLDLASGLANLGLADTMLSTGQVSGSGQLVLPDLTRLSGLAGRDLGGRLAADLTFDLDPLALTGTGTLSAKTDSLQTGIAQADGFLSGTTDIAAELKLDGPDTLSLSAVSVKNARLQLTGDAGYAAGELNSDFTLSLPDLALADARLAGSLDLSAQTSGPLDRLNVAAKAASGEILLAGTPLENLTLTVDATADKQAPSALVKGAGDMNGQTISVDLELASDGGGATLNPLAVRIAGNTVSGGLTVNDLENPLETLSGDLKIDAPDLASLSPLVLTEIAGRVTGTLSADPGTGQLRLNLDGADIDAPSLSLGTLKLSANLQKPYDPQTVSADLELTDLLTPATPVRNVILSATPEAGGTALSGSVKLAEDARDGLTLAAHLAAPGADSYTLTLNQLGLVYQGIESRLKQPATLTYAAGTTSTTPLEMALGKGSLTVSGSAGDVLGLKADLDSVPLSLANAFVSNLGIGGTLSGSVTAKGSSSAPEAAWTLTGSGLAANALRDNGLPSLGLTSSGSFKNNQIRQQTKLSDGNGLSFSADGTIGTTAPQALALAVNGTIPTAALRRPLLQAGLRAEGGLTLKGTIGGSAASPQYALSATPSGLRVTSLSTGLTVQNIRGTASATQDQVKLDGIAGDLATGGSLTASGTIGMKDGLAANLSLALDKARYIDPGLVTAEIDAAISVTGPLAAPGSSPLIDGTVTINKADVSIPETIPGAISPVEVRHVHASAAVRQQVADLGGDQKSTSAEQRSNPPRLNVLVSAPGRIFIRGRGLDAELEGRLKVVGTTADPQAIGAFSLRRGQFDILTRRLTFSYGRATFDGSLTPILDFAATSSVSDTTITVAVTGAADNPEISFTSSPELPQDEVLALLLFGKRVGNLSGTQIAQLGAAIATLTGGSDNGPLAQIRKSLGLDTIDIDTTGENGPSVSVGRYINDNIYLGVEQGTARDSSRIKVDIDLDRGLKVRGEVGADGSSKAGIFFEREY